MEISKINSVNYKNNGKLSFQARVKIPKVRNNKVTESTLKLVSSVTATTGIAQLMLNKSDNDYTTILAKNIKLANLTREDEKAVVDALEIAPTIIDIALSTKNKDNRTRFISKSNIETIVECYEINPDLTEELVVELNDEGDFKFSAREIKHIVDAYEVSPELLETTKKNPKFVTEMLNKIDEDGSPIYGIKDIITFDSLQEKDKNFAQNAIKQHLTSGKPRFFGEEAEFLQQNMEDKFVQFLFNESEERLPDFQFDFRLSGNDIKEIYSICKTDEDKNFAKNLLINYFPSKEGYIEKLSSKIIIAILKRNNIGICEMFNNSYNKRKLIKILSFKNGNISLEELKRMVLLKNSLGDNFFNVHDLKTISPENYPEAIVALAKTNYSQEHEIDFCCYAKLYPELTYEIMNSVGKDKDKGYFTISPSEISEILNKGKENPELMKDVFKFVKEYQFYSYCGPNDEDYPKDLRLLLSKFDKKFREEVINCGRCSWNSKERILKTFDILKDLPTTKKYYPV